jgi:hypothetical protein
VYVYTRDGGHVVALSQRSNHAYWYEGDTTSSEAVEKWITEFRVKKLSAAGS